jgi:protein-disulfide isomerase
MRSFCNINELFNCDTVAASRYADFPLGIPASTAGAAWAGAILILSLIARRSSWREEASRMLILLAVLGLGATLYYLLVMAAVLKTFCLLCLAFDALVIGIFILIWKAWRARPASSSSLSKSLQLAAASCVVVIGITMGFKRMQIFRSDAAKIQAVLSETFSQAPISIADTDEHPSEGPPAAPVVLIDFFDFDCPYCHLIASIFQSLRTRFPDEVRVSYRNFPLDPACNPVMKGKKGHPGACEGARAGVCAHQQGKFLDFYKHAMDREAKLAKEDAMAISSSIGLDMKEFERCMASPESMAAVNRDIELGQSIGVRGTPSLYINGYLLQSWVGLEPWVALIEHALKSAKSPSPKS